MEIVLQIVYRFVSEAPSCAYLPDRASRLEYELATRLSPQEYEDRMNTGWRKFGAILFHPVCLDCSACRPIRIVADQFQPNRSQQRALHRNMDLRVQFASPTVDQERLALYQKYHQAQANRKGWETEDLDAEDYAQRFLYNPLQGIEISIWNETELYGVALTEQTPNTLSGIYHYHAPEHRARSLGTLLMLQTIALARRLAKPYAYFGFYVDGCGSLAYKANFRPCEILQADGSWQVTL